MPPFRFKQFEVRNDRAALKVGTDAVLLGTLMTIRQEDRKLLDIGTGTGVIALIAAQRNMQANITGIDIDGPSAEEAALNFAASPWPDRLQALCVPLSAYQLAFDHIFSNPPYYDDSLTNPSVRESRARHTLTDGTAESLSYREICAYASQHLAADGHLSLILPAECNKALVRTAASFGLFLFRIISIKTTPGKPVKRIVAEFVRIPVCSVKEETLTIMDGGRFTDEYLSLTGDYYLG